MKKGLIGFAIGFFLTIIVPLILVASVIAAPVNAIADFFSIFSKKPATAKEVVDSIQLYLKTEIGQKEIYHVYEMKIQEAKAKYNVDIPLKYLFVPNVLSGYSISDDSELNLNSILDDQIKLALNENKTQKEVEETDKEGKKVKKIIEEVSYSLKELYVYVGDLKQHEYYKKMFKDVGQSLLADYVRAADTLVFEKDTEILGNYTGSSSMLKVYSEGWGYPFDREYEITSPFGWRLDPLGSFKQVWHDGVDFGSPTGTPLYSIVDGTVSLSAFWDCGGNALIVKANNGFEIHQYHLSQRLVDVGDKVKKGQLIAYTGGGAGLGDRCTTGSHLHFGMYDPNGVNVNPLNYINPNVLKKGE